MTLAVVLKFHKMSPLGSALVAMASTSCSDLLSCLPSRISLNPRTDCDGIPQKLLNYMAAGRAVVSFSGSGKILEHAKTGWIVENGNVNAFAEAVLFLLDNPMIAQKLGDNAREYVTLKHTWEKVAEGAEDIYERVLRENHSSASSPIFVPNS
jgi:glycosyltransferase involved in cell wall biosynthesis